MAKHIKDIKGYHIHYWSFSNSSIKKIYDCFIASPVIVVGGLPSLVILSKGVRELLTEKRTLDYSTYLTRLNEICLKSSYDEPKGH